MPSINAWMGNTFPLATWLASDDHGVDTARMIADKSTSITAVRGGVAQTAQTVRLETLRGKMEYTTPGGDTAVIDAVVIGYKGHPTITDTDLQRGDRFFVDGQMYEVVTIVPGTVDSLQAYCEVKS
jgi:hypothetical protein